MGGWRQGISWVAGFRTVVFTVLVLRDLCFELRSWRPIGERVQVWARRYPVFSAALIAFLGAMLGHFFLNKGW